MCSLMYVPSLDLTARGRFYKITVVQSSPSLVHIVLQHGRQCIVYTLTLNISYYKSCYKLARSCVPQPLWTLFVSKKTSPPPQFNISSLRKAMIILCLVESTILFWFCVSRNLTTSPSQRVGSECLNAQGESGGWRNHLECWA